MYTVTHRVRSFILPVGFDIFYASACLYVYCVYMSDFQKLKKLAYIKARKNEELKIENERSVKNLSKIILYKNLDL